MSKSAIYTALSTPVVVADGENLPLGITVRRFGQNITQDGDTIELCGCGYYKIDATATLDAAAAGPVSVALYKDGVAVPGAESTITIAGTSDTTVLPLTAIVRTKCARGSVLTIRVTGTDIMAEDVAVTVVKL